MSVVGAKSYIPRELETKFVMSAVNFIINTYLTKCVLTLDSRWERSLKLFPYFITLISFCFASLFLIQTIDVDRYGLRSFALAFEMTFTFSALVGQAIVFIKFRKNKNIISEINVNWKIFDMYLVFSIALGALSIIFKSHLF